MHFQACLRSPPRLRFPWQCGIRAFWDNASTPREYEAGFFPVSARRIPRSFPAFLLGPRACGLSSYALVSGCGAACFGNFCKAVITAIALLTLLCVPEMYFAEMFLMPASWQMTRTGPHATNPLPFTWGFKRTSDGPNLASTSWEMVSSTVETIMTFFLAFLPAFSIA